MLCLKRKTKPNLIGENWSGCWYVRMYSLKQNEIDQRGSEQERKAVGLHGDKKGIWNFVVMLGSSNGASPAFKRQVLGWGGWGRGLAGPASPLALWPGHGSWAGWGTVVRCWDGILDGIGPASCSRGPHWLQSRVSTSPSLSRYFSAVLGWAGSQGT